MSSERFRLALEQTGPGDWQTFERLAMSYVAIQYPELRPTATLSGDKGRDAELFSPDGVPHVAFQFSVAKDWESKVKDTLRRVQQNLPNVTTLVYVTNQSVGAKADSLKKESLRAARIVVDVLDIDWFLVKYDTSGHPGLERIADGYARLKVDPLLEKKGLIHQKPMALSGEEAQAALLYLELQWENDAKGKGLTKICFDALVRSVLRETDPDNRLPRQVIRAGVRRLLL